MLTKKELYRTKEYWIDETQNEIYRQVSNYMQTNNLNQNQLAEKLGVSKGYISQILNGNCNFTISKLIELSLALGKAPIVQYVNTDELYESEKHSKQLPYKEYQKIMMHGEVKTMTVISNCGIKAFSIASGPKRIEANNDYALTA